MNLNKPLAGHLAALLTILIWGTTFISTKVLLDAFTPVEILFTRFLIGYLALWLVCPHGLRVPDKKQECYFAAAGLCGVTLYYLLENIALTYTLASHVGVITSIAPFFTAVFDMLFLGGKRPGARFFCGFVIALSGIFLISYRTDAAASFHLFGDFLAVASAAMWAGYSALTKKLGSFGHSTIQTTRRTFCYGLLFMIPCLVFTDFHLTLPLLAAPKNLLNLLFLGLGASALCFVTWNFAVRLLGAVKTSVYIYLVPVITTVASAAILQERLTVYTACGIILTLIGLFLSESKKFTKELVPHATANAQMRHGD